MRVFPYNEPTMLCRLLSVSVVLCALCSAQAAEEWRAQALARESNGDMAGALAVLERAAERAPGSAQLQDEIGAVLGRMNRPSEAIVRFAKAAQLDPNYAPAQ